jgi:hypothetical protein
MNFETASDQRLGDTHAHRPETDHAHTTNLLSRFALLL